MRTGAIHIQQEATFSSKIHPHLPICERSWFRRLHHRYSHPLPIQGPLVLGLEKWTAAIITPLSFCLGGFTRVVGIKTLLLFPLIITMNALSLP